MILLRNAKERGHAKHGWLESYHTFSFADYHDPQHMGFSDLRVINEDRVQQGQGFGTHPHRDMEIVSYVLEGSLEHRDSLGTGSVIKPGDVQRMSAGTGVTHSEFNPSATEGVHFLQIWILPERTSISPSYEQKNFSLEQKTNRLCLVVSREKKEGSLKINQDAEIFASVLKKSASLKYSMPEQRKAWVQVLRGTLDLNGHVLSQGDGAAVTEPETLQISGTADSEFLLFNLRA